MENTNIQNTPNQLPEIKPSVKSNSYKYLFFLFLVLFLITLGVLITLIASKNNSVPKVNNNIEPTPKAVSQSTENPEPSNTDSQSQSNTQELENQIKKIISGDIDYKKSEYSELMTYSQQIEFPTDSDGERNFATANSVIITAYKYIPGQIIETAYEGSTWEINVDNWVHYLQEITPRTAIAKVVSTWLTGDELVPIIGKEFGEYTLAIYDQFFKPAGTVSRYFTTYDKTNNQIVEIEIRAFTFSQNFTIPQYSALYEYSDNTEEYFNQIESIISSSLSK